jgi:hypothetical protein
LKNLENLKSEIGLPHWEGDPVLKATTTASCPCLGAVSEGERDQELLLAHQRDKKHSAEDNHSNKEVQYYTAKILTVQKGSI